MINDAVRTRFAPSPTGFLHLGGARTALFCYLFAKHHQGKFVIRFEDTDQVRNQLQTITKLLDDLKWLGLQIDETLGTESEYGSYLQSERLTYYQTAVAKLLTAKQAYYCFCTKETLQQVKTEQLTSGIKAPGYNRHCWKLDQKTIDKKITEKTPYCIRLFVENDQKLTLNDLVYGEVVFTTDHIEDFVIIKTDGFPTYNFAAVVDDHDMKISHVLRGSDHLANTGKQLYLYQIFQWTPPYFGHLSLIQFNHLEKMSKRVINPLQDLSYYRKEGYLPEAIFNYLATLGWTIDKFQEIWKPQDLIKKFNGKRLNKASSTFSLHKLQWIGKKHIQKLTTTEFLNYWKEFSLDMPLKTKYSEAQWNIIGQMFQHEISHFKKLPEIVMKYFTYQIADPIKTKIIWTENYQLLEAFIAGIRNLSWTEKNILQFIYDLGKKFELKGRKLMKPLYWTVIGNKEGPKIDRLFFLIGKKQILDHVLQQKQAYQIQKKAT